MILSDLLTKRYEPVKSLGKGAMGEVVLARDLKRGTLVAIKSVLASAFADEEAGLRFLREALITSALSHPNIIRVIDQGKDIGRLYIVLEYVEGGSLGDLLRERGPLSPIEFCQIAVSVLDAVAYAHRSKVLHRDLKTDNILLDREMQPRIADFGLAKGIDDAGLETVSGTMMGSPLYMAPEVARGQRATEATDQYALGVVLYQMLCGRPPLIAENPLEMLQKHIEEVPPPATTFRPEVPAALSAALNRALAKRPEDRWPDVASLRDAINAMAHAAATGWGALAGEPAHAAVPAGAAASSSTAAPAVGTASSPSTRRRRSGTVPVLVPLPPEDVAPSTGVSHSGASASGAAHSGASSSGTSSSGAVARHAPPPRWLLRVAAFAMLVAGVLTYGAKPGARPPGVGDLVRGPVRGALGLPLGQVVTVFGVAVDGASTGRKADADLTLLRIDSVNDARLARPIDVPFESPAWQPVPAPKAGKRFRLLGYETGRFSGLPESARALAIEVPATTTFAWSVEFVVLKDVDRGR